MKQYKVMIVNSANDPSMSAIANDYSFPALSPLALGTWINRRIAGATAIARDGAVRSLESLISELDTEMPDLLGISMLSTSYQNTLALAKEAQKRGIKVVVGNDQASQNSISILENRPEIDYVIGAEYGELDLELLTRHMMGESVDLEKIPTLTYRENNEIKGFDYENPEHRKRLGIVNLESRYPQLAQYTGLVDPDKPLKRSIALDLFGIPDRSLYPEDHWEAYKENFTTKFGDKLDFIVEGVTTMNRARGCNRQDEYICKHCDMVLDVSRSSPELYWEDVKTAHEQTGANVFYEVCDSFSSFKRFVKDVADSKPDDLGFEPKFMVYAQASDIAKNPGIIDDFKRIGVYKVNMGLEAMSDTTLKHMKGEKDSVAKNYFALDKLKEAGIQVYASIVIGSEAETEHTLFQETVPRVIDLIRRGYIADAEAQPVLPLAGNYQGAQMKKHGMMQVDPQNPDWPQDLDRLSEAYINQFSGVSYGQASLASLMIRHAAQEAGINYGSGVSKEK